MSQNLDIHSIQAAALRVLMYKPTAAFTELNTGKASTDQFNFHLKQLLKQGLVHKDKMKYELTPKGKEFTNRFDVDTHDVKYEKQAKVGVLVAARKKIGKQEYWLLQQRLKQPFYGFFGRITGKVRRGDTTEQTALRELQEETGLTAGKLTFKGVEHKFDYSKEGELLDEKFFFIYIAENLTGKLVEEFEGGKNFWFTKQEAKKQNEFDDAPVVNKILDGKGLSYVEKKYTVTGF